MPLLDEPNTELAPNIVDDMFGRVNETNDAGTTILTGEQNTKEPLRRCDCGYVLVNGRSRYEDDGDSHHNDEDVHRESSAGSGSAADQDRGCGPSS